MRVLLSLVARWCGYGGALSLAAMMLITVADVSSRALFNKPITGAYDLVQLFLVGTVFLSVPDVFWRGENIVIDLVDHIGRPVGVAWLKALASVTALIFLAVLAWRMVPPALELGDVSRSLARSLDPDVGLLEPDAPWHRVGVADCRLGADWVRA